MALNFPASPTVDQVYTEGSSSWKWDGTSWNSNSTNSIISLTGAGTTTVTGTFPDLVITSNENLANTANTLAQSSFDKANTATTNAATADQRAVTSGSYANSAFATANASFIQANTSELVSNSITTVMIANANVTSQKLASNLSLTGNLTVQSTVNATDFNSTSDISLKDNIIRIENSLDILEKITGISFTWKENNEISYGLSAQEVEKVLPGIVKERPDGIKGINYINLIAFLIEAIKELKNEVTNLKNINR